MTELFLMRGTPAVFCYAPFAVGGVVRDERQAFDNEGTIFCRFADTLEHDRPGDIRDVGDVVEILLSLCWSKKAALALEGIRWSPTIRLRDVEVRNSKDDVLDVFQWACDFGLYDVLDRTRSDFDVMEGTDAVFNVRYVAVDSRRIPECDAFGWFYGRGLLVKPRVRHCLEQSACEGCSFQTVEVT